MSKRLTTRGIATATAIGNHETFSTSGALRATSDKVGPWDSGWLSGVDHETFHADMASIVYTVFSYGTPIAWVTDAGKVHKVSQKFSVTTSKHQGNLYLL